VITNVGTGSPNRLLHSFFVEVSMSGPSGDIECGTHTWNSSVSGVGTNYTYLWQRRSSAWGTWQTVGTGPSLTLDMCPSPLGTTIRVTATSEAGFHAGDARNMW
jgi:hypothetical protein